MSFPPFPINARVRWTRGGKAGTVGTVIGLTDSQRPIIKTDAGRVHGDPHGITPSNLEMIDPYAVLGSTPAPASEATETRKPASSPVIGAEYKPALEAPVIRPEALARMRASLVKDLEHAERPRDTHTPKKLAYAMQARMDAARYRRAIAVIDGIGPRLPAGTARADLLAAIRMKTAPVANGYHGYHVETDGIEPVEPGTIAAQIREIPFEAPPAAPDTAILEAQVKFADIPGFFPTPPDLAEQVCQLAGIEPGMQVLEPSAGIGSLAEVIERHGGHPICCEINGDLVEILEAKGFETTQVDFRTVKGWANRSRIVMNPPFEHRQDAEHIMHAWTHLAPGGRMVAICSPALLTATDSTATAFRDWVDTLPCDVEVHENGQAFDGKDAFRKTSVATITLVFNKP